MNDYERVARVIRHMDEVHGERPTLSELAAHAGLSPAHFHRLFSEWAGVTPKNFLQCLTHARARRSLLAGESVLDAALDAGLTGAGRLHDLCVKWEAATPGELKSGGAGWTITIGLAESPFGRVAIGENRRGICHLAFVDAEVEAFESIGEDWPRAEWVRDDERATELASGIFESPEGGAGSLRAHVRGTPFQVKVWRALLRVPPGRLVSYGQLAQAVGNPSASRAVGAAVGRNHLAYLIPCHRVIRESGALGGYRWGLTRKRVMMAREAARGPVAQGR